MNEPKTFLEDEDGIIEIVPLKYQVVSLLQKKEVGAATELLVKEVATFVNVYTTREDKMSEMWIYHDGIYVPNGEAIIKEYIRTKMQDHYSDWLANQVLAKIKVDTYIDSQKFFQEREHQQYEIVVENGILDLRTLNLMPFDPKKIFFSKIPVYYNPEAQCPKIEQFLKDIMKDESDITVYYEIAGFGLVKEYFMEKSFMFVGNGRNGKGKSIELLKRLVGVQNTSSVPLSALTSSSPFVSSLWKRLFNLAGDISSSDLKETGMFKQLTGRDPISANRKWKNIVEFTNYAKLVFSCNELPRVYDYSDGFWDRWILLEFPYKFVDEHVYNQTPESERAMLKIKNKNIIKEIVSDEEMSGFLNQAVAGLHRIMKNSRFSYSKGTDEVKNQWIRKSDSFMAFCMDLIEEDYEGKISKKDLRKIYKEYCSTHNIKGTSDVAIKRILQDMYGVSEEFGVLNTVGHQERYWSGIKFKESKDA